MQQSHHQGIFPGSTWFNPVHPGPEFAGSSRYCPRFTKIYLQSHHHGSLRFAPVDTRQPPGLINQDHPGGHPFHPGGHPVHPGQHTVNPGQHTVHYGSLRFITMPYGSLRFIPVNTRFIAVHYGIVRFITGIVTIPVNTRFITVHYGSSRSTPGSSRSTAGLNFLPGLMPVQPNYQTCLIF